MFIPEETITIERESSWEFLRNESEPDPNSLEFNIGTNTTQLPVLLLMAVFQTLYYVVSVEDSRKLAFKMVLGSAAVYLGCISSALNLHLSHLLEDPVSDYGSVYSSVQTLINVGITLLLLLAQVMAIEQRTQEFQKKKANTSSRLITAIVMSITILSTIAILDTSARVHRDIVRILY